MMMMRKHRCAQIPAGTHNLTSDVTFKPLRKQQVGQYQSQEPEPLTAALTGPSSSPPKGSSTSGRLLELFVDVRCHRNRAPDSGGLTCLKLCLYSLQAVSTVNLVLKMLQSLAP